MPMKIKKEKGKSEGNDVKRKWFNSLQRWNVVTVLLWKSWSPTHFVWNFILELTREKTKNEKKRAKESSPKEIFIETLGAGQ